MNALIDKLKDPTKVKAFGLMEPEEREVYEQVGKKSCNVYSADGVWVGAANCPFVEGTTYAIKPDYHPDPEFVDLEIRQAKEFLGIEAANTLGVLLNGDFTRISFLVNEPNFDCFYYVDEYDETELQVNQICCVAGHIAKGHKVYARFRR